MMLVYFLGSLFRNAVLTGAVLLMVGVTSAQMSSSNYQIQSDSVNVGGGYSSSTSYQLESTTGEVATGNSTSTNYSLYAGYQQMHEVYLAVGAIGNVTMSPGLPGLTGGTSTGQTAVHVVTDSQAGYQMTITAANNPAMQSGAQSIANYVASSSVPDFTFITDATDAHFGFSPEGPDIAQRYKDNGSVCGTGSSDAIDRCWDALLTSEQIIAVSSAANHPAGATTTLKFRVGIGGQQPVIEGVYVATSTVTVLPL